MKKIISLYNELVADISLAFGHGGNGGDGGNIKNLRSKENARDVSSQNLNFNKSPNDPTLVTTKKLR